jgi:DNA-binding NarL/FixJ family response regulator
VLLLDIAMPDQSGIDILRTIRQGQPNLPVLILSGYPAQQYALNLFKMGANGYLNKECEADELKTAVRTVYQGRRYVSSTVGELLAQSFDRDPNTACIPSCRTASSRFSCAWPRRHRVGHRRGAVAVDQNGVDLPHPHHGKDGPAVE